jgi:hypothetical protein
MVYRAVVSLHACRSAVLKVPRHGSSNNLDEDFFERITADHYAFSGDAEHDNPEREALRMLLNAPWSSEKHSLLRFWAAILRSPSAVLGLSASSAIPARFSNCRQPNVRRIGPDPLANASLCPSGFLAIRISPLTLKFRYRHPALIFL